MGTVTKRYLDKAGLEYLVNKIKNEYHKVTHNSVSSGKYSVLLTGATSATSGKAYAANFSNDIQYDTRSKTLTSPKIGATAIYQKTNQVVDTIKTNAPDGTVKTWTNSNGTVTIDAITGATGAQGVTGARGVTGKDGVAAGFDTPATVVNVLSENATPTVGVSASGTDTNKKFTFTFGFPKGLRGITGAQGNTGPQGAQGADGPRGATGERGSQGPQGAKGLQGVTGLQGDKGPTGNKGADGPRGVTGARGSQGPRGVQGATGGAGFIASVDRRNFTKANWETCGAVGHQENWTNTTIPAGMIAGDLFVITGCATDTGDGYQLVYKYDPAFQPGSTTLRGTCISSHIIARKGATGTIGGVTVSGSGNAVTGASLSGGTLTLTKGTSFLPLTGGTLTGNLNMKGTIAYISTGSFVDIKNNGYDILTVDTSNGRITIGDSGEGTGCFIHNWGTNFEFDLPINATRVNASEGFFQTSDIRKKNIKEELDLEKCYEMLDKCQEVLYTLKGDSKEQVGMIAQEVEEFFPEIISTDKDGFKSIDYAKLSVICLRIVKDLYKRVLLLENK